MSKVIKPHPFLISVAPMMDWTDRHDRYFLRLIAPDVRLYSEMITSQALNYADNPTRFLKFSDQEHPIALQLGGSDPELLAKAAKMGEAQGYDEINLNVGCPSDRVQSGKIGACLMLEPQLVARCVAAMKSVVDIPVTVKCRIGVDDQDGYPSLKNFIKRVSEAGCQTFIIHARKAWLKGLSPKENREVPPLSYETVYQIKKDFPHLRIIINGGIKTVEEIDAHLQQVDGVMLGRAAYHNPYLLAGLQEKYFENKSILSRSDVAKAFIPYVDSQLKQNIKLTTIVRHIMGLFQGQKGARSWRRHLSDESHKNNTAQVIEQALKYIEVDYAG